MIKAALLGEFYISKMRQIKPEKRQIKAAELGAEKSPTLKLQIECCLNVQSVFAKKRQVLQA